MGKSPWIQGWTHYTGTKQLYRRLFLEMSFDLQYLLKHLNVNVFKDNVREIQWESVIVYF